MSGYRHNVEKRVLHYLWETPEAEAKKVHDLLTKPQGGTLTTIQSPLDSLFKKGLLTRQKQGHAYYYRAKVDREALIAQLIQDVTSDFVRKDENSLIAAFSSVSSGLDDDKLLQLETLIQQQRQRLGQEDPDGD